MSEFQNRLIWHPKSLKLASTYYSEPQDYYMPVISLQMNHWSGWLAILVPMVLRRGFEAL